MNPMYGIVMWIVIGALAGWIGSMIVGTDERQGAIGNVVSGVLGAMLGGFLAQVLLGDDPTNNGVFASFAVALFGACIVMLIWGALSGTRRRRRA